MPCAKVWSIWIVRRIIIERRISQEFNYGPINFCNPLIPRKCDCNLNFSNFKLISRSDILDISWWIALIWMHPINDKWILVQVLAWCHQAVSHHPSQCRPRSMSPYGVTRLLWLYPDSKVHGANMGPTWVLSVPDGPHIGPMNLAISVIMVTW